LGWLHAPLQAWPRAVRRVVVVAAALLATAFWAAMTRRMQPVFSVPDSASYLRLATGDVAHVMQPWASRQLGVLVVRALAAMLHVTVRQAFLIEAAVALFVTLLVVDWLLLRADAPRWMLVAVAVLPSWAMLVQYLALPDLWYAAMIAVLLVTLEREWLWAACGMMLPLMLSRESTSLTLLCFLFAAWRRLRWGQRVCAVSAAALGAVAVSRLAAGAMSNVEHIPQALYLFAKVPWNFMRNVLGVLPWSNVNTDLCRVPVWQMPLHAGSVQAVGVCGVSMQQQVAAVTAAMMQFGLLPLLFLAVWLQRRMRRDDSVLLRFSLVYGGACFLLAPVLGAGFAHLVGYAWPLFLVAGPLLLGEVNGEGRRSAAAIGFFALHMGLCATADWFPPVWVRTVVDLAFWAGGVWTLRMWLRTSASFPQQVY
jgi:hypothetical protein